MKIVKLMKQPNGKYCGINERYRLEFYNYSKSQIMDLYIEQAKIDMNNAEELEKVMNDIWEFQQEKNTKKH